jgi:hypothetical protein
LLWDPAAGNATAVHALLQLVSRPAAISIYGVVALLAAFGLFYRRGCVWCLLPQQFVLMLSAVGAGMAMWAGAFADGVARPPAFIIADQMPAILAAIGHTYAIITIATTRE